MAQLSEDRPGPICTSCYGAMSKAGWSDCSSPTISAEHHATTARCSPESRRIEWRDYRSLANSGRSYDSKASVRIRPRIRVQFRIADPCVLSRFLSCINVFMHQHYFSCVLRTSPRKSLNFEKLLLPEILKEW